MARLGAGWDRGVRNGRLAVVALAGLLLMGGGRVSAAQRWTYSSYGYALSDPAQPGEVPREMDLVLDLDHALRGAVIRLEGGAPAIRFEIQGLLLHGDGRAETFSSRLGGVSVSRFAAIVRGEDGLPRKFQVEGGDRLYLVGRVDWIPELGRDDGRLMSLRVEVEGRPHSSSGAKTASREAEVPGSLIEDPRWDRWLQGTAQGFATRLRGPRSYPPRAMRLAVEVRGRPQLRRPCVRYLQYYGSGARIEADVQVSFRDGRQHSEQFELVASADPEAEAPEVCFDTYLELGKGDWVSARFNLRELRGRPRQFLRSAVTLDLRWPPEPD